MAAGKRRRRRPVARETELIKMAELSRRSSVPAPTIKHYIREGLLPGPEVRTSRNMAYYDGRLVARIRAIKELQAERFLPLKVIGTILEPSPSDRLRPERDLPVPKKPLALARTIVDEGLRRRRKRSEVMKTFGLTRAELDTLEKAGVLELRGEGETAGYSGIDLQLLDILADVRRSGLSELFPPAVAEPYLAAVRTLVAFEIDLFRRRVQLTGVPDNLEALTRRAIELGGRLITGLRAKVLPGMLRGLVIRGG